jgi:plastocyanin
MRALSALAFAASLTASPALAGDITIDIRDAAGRPVPNAVAMVRPAGRATPATPIKVSWPLVMAQKDVQFSPYVLIAPVGSTVSFPNRDKVRHHVYSFSAAKKFELKLYGRDESRTVTFDKPGAVSLGCNIHDTMIAFIYVTDTPFAAKSGTDGMAVVQDAPAGAATLLVWHPDLKSKTPVSRPLTVASAGQRTSVSLEMRPSVGR